DGGSGGGPGACPPASARAPRPAPLRRAVDRDRARPAGRRIERLDELPPAAARPVPLHRGGPVPRRARARVALPQPPAPARRRRLRRARAARADAEPRGARARALPRGGRASRLGRRLVLPDACVPLDAGRARRAARRHRRAARAVPPRRGRGRARGRAARAAARLRLPRSPGGDMTVELDRYADLIVRVGANVQPGQVVFVNGLVEHAPLVRAITERAYAAGARYVDAPYGDLHLRKSFVTHAADDDLSTTWPWDLRRYEALHEGAALIAITGDPEPELLADVDLARLGRARPLEGTKLYVQAVTERRTNWTIAAYPTEGQARQVFGEPDVERLWDAVARAVRLDADDPVQAWREHLDLLRNRAERLN